MACGAGKHGTPVAIARPAKQRSDVGPSLESRSSPAAKASQRLPPAPALARSFARSLQAPVRGSGDDQLVGPTAARARSSPEAGRVCRAQNRSDAQRHRDRQIGDHGHGRALPRAPLGGTAPVSSRTLCVPESRPLLDAIERQGVRVPGQANDAKAPTRSVDADITSPRPMSARGRSCPWQA